MKRPTLELAGIIKNHRSEFSQKCAPLKNHLRVLNAIEHCRTDYFGGHMDRCDTCEHERISYNSCRNRHCPKCQGTNRERWILSRQDDLLPCTYFHVVFTLPQELHWFCLKHPAELYNCLFYASKETVLAFGRDPKHLGAQTGMISVLHTWGQNLALHPHVHLIVPGGGITKAGNWKHAKSNGAFLFPVKAMSLVYRAKFMERLKSILPSLGHVLEPALRRKLFSKNWVVYAKQPFGGPKQVIEYLGRYSHKIAISNHRLITDNNGLISFSYKDYAHGSVKKVMQLSAHEFLRRFCLHILPARFMKIRHYGILASRVKPQLKIQQMKMGIIIRPKVKRDWKEITKTKLHFDVEACPCCKTGKMIRIATFQAHAPPSRSNKKLRMSNKPVC